MLIFLAVTLAAGFTARFTTFGRRLYAIGGNREAARLSGLPVSRDLFVTYTLSGLLAGLAGLLAAAQLLEGSSLIGRGYELGAIAAVVVGGASLMGGRGDPISAVIGCFIIEIIVNIMNLVGISSEPQLVIKGAVILLAVFQCRGSGPDLGRPVRSVRPPPKAGGPEPSVALLPAIPFDDERKTMKTRPFATSELSVTPLCVGTSPLGNFPSQYGYEVSAERAIATMRRVFEGPITFIDTSNNYGNGESERRIGKALAEVGGLPPGFVLATKVDPAEGSDDFSGARVRASVAESLERLGVDRLQLVYLHDPERITFAEATASGGAVEALVQLRDEGVIDYIGVAGGPIDLMRDYLATEVFQAVISHNRYTLVDQSAEPLIEDAAARGTRS